MKRSSFKKNLAEYLVKRDKHLALNSRQAAQLVEYIEKYCDDIGMLPPSKSYILEYNNPEMLKGFNVVLNAHTWEPES